MVNKMNNIRANETLIKGWLINLKVNNWNRFSHLFHVRSWTEFAQDQLMTHQYDILDEFSDEALQLIADGTISMPSIVDSALTTR